MTGNDLHALRKALGLTQAEMADHIGLTLRPYVAIEHKDDKPIRKIHQLAVERVTLRLAAERSDPMLATAGVRSDAVAVTRELEGRGDA